MLGDAQQHRLPRAGAARRLRPHAHRRRRSTGRTSPPGSSALPDRGRRGDRVAARSPRRAGRVAAVRQVTDVRASRPRSSPDPDVVLHRVVRGDTVRRGARRAPGRCGARLPPELGRHAARAAYGDLARPSCGDELAPRRPGEDAFGRERYRCGRATSSAPRWTWTRPTSGAWPSSTASSPSRRPSRRRSPAREPRRAGASTGARRGPGAQARRHGRAPGVDAARPPTRRSPRWTASTSTSRPAADAGVPHRADADTVASTTPGRRTTSPDPAGCGGPCRRA